MEHLLTEILTELKKQTAGPGRLWTADDIATFLSLSKASISARIVCLPSFPEPIQIPGSTRRWHQDDVQKWARRHKKTK